MHRRSIRFISTLLLFVSLPCLLLAGTGKNFTLVIDAGHGGHDPGAIGTYSKEKNINLNVALKVGEMIQKNCPDVKVVFTRKTDVFVDLHERAAIANRAKANLFISIHTNALENGAVAYGSETYSLGMARAKENLDVSKRENSVILYESNYKERYAGFNPKSSESYIIFEFMQDQYMKQSAELARDIQRQYVKVASRPDKGVHQGGLLVLRETSMPSVLTELGFITTPQEEQYLNSAKGTDELAQSIYEGFLDYRNVQERHKSVVLSMADDRGQNDGVQASSDDLPSQKTEEQDDNGKRDSAARPPVQKPQPTNTDNAKNKEGKDEKDNEDDDNAIPVFKIQILVSARMLRPDCSQFKSLSPVDSFRDKNLYKYTYGCTSSYKDIIAMRKSILDKFPDCFVIAMKGKSKISIQEAQSILRKTKH